MNYRPHNPKAFGNRGYDPPNPWLSEEEIFNMRRSVPLQFQSAMQNVPSAMHSPYLNQNTLGPSVNKNFINQNSCNMSNMNFSYAPNPEVFKSSHSVNDSSYTNRLINDRFPSNSYSQANMQHKISDDLLFKDLPPPNMSQQFSKSDAFSENSSKMFSNVRAPIERFSCMQKDQTQFNRKFDDPQIFQGKDFPFSNKEMQSLPVSFIDKVPVSVGSNFPSCKPNYKAPSLFPAYTPKDNNETLLQKSQSVPDEISKSVLQSAYSSDYAEKVSTNYFDKANLSSKYSKTTEPFPAKTESFQERDLSLNEIVFPPQSNSQSYMHEKSPFKSMSNSPIPQDSLKALENTVSPANSKFPFTSGSQDACFQSSNEIPFQTSQGMQMINHSNSSISRDCFMQNVAFSGSGTSLHSISENTTVSSQLNALQSSKETFSSFESSSQSNVHQSSSFNVTSSPNVRQITKETFSLSAVSSQPNIQPSFNFENNMSTADITDLLPGLDAFLTESCKSEGTLNKCENVNSKNDTSKSSVTNSAFDDDDELSKHSIPFIGDTQVSSSNIQNDIKSSYCDQTTTKDKFEFEPEKSSEQKLATNNESTINIPDKKNSQKEATVDKEASRSALEEAIDLLVKCDAIVGLDYIIEYKRNMSQQGSFPFRCKLCNSAITRPSIIDHIIGSKHRMRYVKSKNESTYEHLVSLKLEKAEKDAKIAEAAFHMELLYGRGRVTVIDDFQSETSAETKNKEIIGHIEEPIEEPVFTLDKIPIGFEALSPEHDDMDTSAFPLESDLNLSKQDACHDIVKEASNVSAASEMNKDVTTISKIDSVLKQPNLENEPVPHHAARDVQLEKLDPEVSVKLCRPETDENNLQMSPASYQVKRSLSPQPTCFAKSLKTECSEKSETCIDLLQDEKSTLIKKEDSSCDEKKALMMDILEEFSKNDISSHEEALMVIKIIGMLIQMLLRYDLPHMTVENLENMLSSLQVSSSEKNIIEDLKSLLNGSKVHDETKEEGSLKMEPSLQDVSGGNVQEKLSSNTENKNSEMNATLNETVVPVSSVNVLNNNGSNILLNTNVSLIVSETSTSTPAQSAMTVAMNATEISKTAIDSNVAFVATSLSSQSADAAGIKPPPFPDLSSSSSANSALNSQNVNTVSVKSPVIPELNVSTSVTLATQSAANTAGLKPPPFFSWPQNNEANPVSYANVQGTQNMMWSNAYQFSQPYAQMSYYQPQNYGNNFSSTQSYQSQFTMMSQPRAPPLPPPPLSNPPLPPSVPLPANLPPSVAFGQPPPPPPPLP